MKRTVLGKVTTYLLSTGVALANCINTATAQNTDDSLWRLEPSPKKTNFLNTCKAPETNLEVNGYERTLGSNNGYKTDLELIGSVGTRTSMGPEKKEGLTANIGAQYNRHELIFEGRLETYVEAGVSASLDEGETDVSGRIDLGRSFGNRQGRANTEITYDPANLRTSAGLELDLLGGRGILFGHGYFANGLIGGNAGTEIPLIMGESGSLRTILGVYGFSRSDSEFLNGTHAGLKVVKRPRAMMPGITLTGTYFTNTGNGNAGFEAEVSLIFPFSGGAFIPGYAKLETGEPVTGRISKRFTSGLLLEGSDRKDKEKITPTPTPTPTPEPTPKPEPRPDNGGITGGEGDGNNVGGNY
jgi:hypothetical protein